MEAAAGEVPEALEPLWAACDSLAAVGFESPSWHDAPQLENTRGWQRAAAQAVDSFCQRALLRELDAPSAALLDSQAGPYAARVFTARPTPLFRVLLLRRLRVPLPLTAARCSRMMFSDITLQPATGLVFCAHVEARLNERLPEFVGRLAPLLQPDERRIEVIANIASLGWRPTCRRHYTRLAAHCGGRATS